MSFALSPHCQKFESRPLDRLKKSGNSRDKR